VAFSSSASTAFAAATAFAAMATFVAATAAATIATASIPSAFAACHDRLLSMTHMKIARVS
jgi:hypothetical protein